MGSYYLAGRVDSSTSFINVLMRADRTLERRQQLSRLLDLALSISLRRPSARRRSCHPTCPFSPDNEDGGIETVGDRRKRVGSARSAVLIRKQPPPRQKPFRKAEAAHLGIKTEVGTGPAGARTRTCGRLPVRSADRELDRTARAVRNGTGSGAGRALTVTTIENAYCAHAFAAALTATIEREQYRSLMRAMTS